MYCISANEEEEDYEDDEELEIESSKPHLVAAQTLSDIALYLPPEKVVTPLLQWAEPAVKGIYIVDSLNYYYLILIFSLDFRN